METQNQICPRCGQVSREVSMSSDQSQSPMLRSRRHQSKDECIQALGKALNDLKSRLSEAEPMAAAKTPDPSMYPEIAQSLAEKKGLATSAASAGSSSSSGKGR